MRDHTVTNTGSARPSTRLPSAGRYRLTAAKGMAARNLDVELIVAAQPL
jgi:hypothetical protein